MPKGKNDNPLSTDTVIIVDILLHVKKTTSEDTDINVPCPPGEVYILL